MNYSEFVTAIATITAYSPTDSNFVAILPDAIQYADNRIFRELDMISEDFRDSSASTTALNRNFTLPTALGTFQVITGINVITPASTAPESGARNQCTMASLDVLDRIYPSTTGAGVPSLYSYFSQATGQTGIIFAPWPDDTYRVEVIGKIIPTALSASNPTTFLTLYLPDLYIAAAMVFMSGFMRNYGAGADDPKQAMSWEQQYVQLRDSAATWEARKRGAGASWSPRQVEPTAQAQRG